MTAPTNRSSAPDEISLRDIWQALVNRRLLIGLTTAFAGVTSIAVALLLTPVYRADVLLMPVLNSHSVGGGLSGLATQFGALGLAGISLPANQKDEAVATLKSRLLTEGFVKDNDLLPVLFENRWDADQKKWTVKSPDDVPTLWKAHELFDEGLRVVTEDRKTGLITLSIFWKDPKVAALWANDLVRRTNVLLRDRAIERSTRNIAYLNGQLEKISSVEVRQALFGLLESEHKNVMVAQGSEEFAFKVIDPAVAPERRFSPRRKLIVLLGTGLGLALSCVASVFFWRLRQTDS